MSDITANIVVSMPSQLFTMARSFKAVANGKIYIGKIDTDPVNPENQIQVYLENEDGSHVPVSQPIVINAAGYPVYNGQIAKFVTEQGHSMAVYDAYGSQQFYFPNVLKYDPDQFEVRLSEANGLSYIGAFDNITQLRTYVGGRDKERVYVNSHTSGMIGGGEFMWDSSSSEDDNNGTIIKPTSTSGSGRWKRIFDTYFVEYFGARNDATDNTDAFFKCVKAAGSKIAGDVYSASINPGVRVVKTQGGSFNITGNKAVILPSMVEIDLCGAEIVGSGTNTIFVTGGYNQTTGDLVDNLTLPENTYRVTGSSIHNGKIRNAGLGYNFKNFAEQSHIYDITFTDCAQCGIATSCHYGAFYSMTTRNPTAPKTHAEPAFVFSTYVNSQNIHHINVTQRKLAYRFDGAVNGQRLEFVNAEGVDKGLVFTGEVMPIEIYGYYEDITDVAIDMGASVAHRSVKINGFFNNVNICFYGNQASHGSFGDNSYFLNCNTKYNSDVGGRNALEVKLPTVILGNNTLPSIPSGWTFGGIEDVKFPVIATDASGNFICRQNYTGGKVDLPFSGDQGDASTTIPFCTQSNSGVATRDIYTSIAFRTHMIVIINLTIEGQKVRGRVYSDATYLDGTVSNITVTPSNNSGFLKLTITGSALPAIPNTITGVVRMP
ncbi:TPA: phage tailspike protein [Escherichia coli]